jgi:polysaccharide chain length determinant protein (PEP-CTERM system associated)
MQVEPTLQLSDLKGIARRRAPLVLGVALSVTLASYWLAMALPNEYESYATVLVEPQAVDPGLVEAGVAQTDLNRRLHLMTAQILSRPRLSRVIDDLGLYKDESHYLVRNEVINIMRGQIKVEPVIPELQQKQVMRGDFEIDQFRIAFRDDDPVVARDVAQRLANDFIQEHIAVRVRTSQKSVEFVEAEVNRLAETIRTVEDRIAQLKAENAGRLPQDVPANQHKLERILESLSDSRREVATARSDESFFRAQSATARELLSGERDDSPEARKRSLELMLADFQARGFTDKHPDVVRARAELVALEEKITAAKAEAAAGPGSLAEHSADAEARRAELRRAHAEEEIARLEEAASQIQELLAQAPEVAKQLDELQREYQHLFQSYQDFSNRRLEAGVQADLERRQLGEQFRVLEAAFLAPGPSSPNRLIIVVIGVVLGFVMGTAIGVVLEAADTTVHTPRQLQMRFNLPVLAAIPEIWLESDRLGLRRQRLRAAGGVAALTLFALVGGAANYWWVNGGRGAPAQSSAAAPAPEAAAPPALPPEPPPE